MLTHASFKVLRVSDADVLNLFSSAEDDVYARVLEQVPILANHAARIDLSDFEPPDHEVRSSPCIHCCTHCFPGLTNHSSAGRGFLRGIRWWTREMIR